MPKIGRRKLRAFCRHFRNQGVWFWSRRHRDSQGEYLRCPECGKKYR